MEEISQKKWRWVLRRLDEFNKSKALTPKQIKRIKLEDEEDKLIKLNEN